MKMKLTERNINFDIPIIIAKLKVIEYLFNTINPSCLKASTIDKFSKESYRIHGLLQDIEDEMFFNESLHQKTIFVSELNDLQKMFVNEIIKMISGVK